jgi:hypothetical protein
MQMTQYTIRKSLDMDLIGDVYIIDASFDHEFGTKRDKEYCVENFSVMVYADNSEFDITKSLDPKMLKYYRDYFLEMAIPKYVLDHG